MKQERSGEPPKIVEVNGQAPVVGKASIEIRSDARRVWGLLAAIGQWPKWNKAIQEVTLKGPLAVGTEFSWKAGSRIESRIIRVEPERLLAWTGRTMGINAIHVYRLNAKGNVTIVETEESFEGLMAWLLKGYLKKVLDQALQDGLMALKTEAERAW